MAHRRVLANQHVALNLMCSETGIQRKKRPGHLNSGNPSCAVVRSGLRNQLTGKTLDLPKAPLGNRTH